MRSRRLTTNKRKNLRNQPVTDRACEWSAPRCLAGYTQRYISQESIQKTITCHIRYEIDPYKLPEFEEYAKMWIPLVNRYGGKHHGYYLLHEGKIYEDFALFSFLSLAEYESYREKVTPDPDFKVANDHKEKTKCTKRIERQFMRPLLE
ncbi:MAG: NIPSNAP family protein [Candidatus Sedimenticola sp. 20ELBAFRAG]